MMPPSTVGLVDATTELEERPELVQVALDGSRIVVASRDRVLLVSPRGGAELSMSVPGTPSRPRYLAASENASIIALQQENGALRVLEADTQRWIGPRNVGELQALAIDTAGQLIVGAGPAAVVAYHPSLENGWPNEIARAAANVAVGKFGDVVLVASKDGQLGWFDRYGNLEDSVTTGQPIGLMAASEDLAWAAAADATGSLGLWDRRGRCAFRLDLPSQPLSLALARDGSLVVATLASGRSVGFGKDGTRVHEFVPTPGRVTGAARIVGPQQEVLVADDRGQIHRLQSSGVPIWSRELSDVSGALSASRDGSLIAWADSDRRLHRLGARELLGAPSPPLGAIDPTSSGARPPRGPAPAVPVGPQMGGVAAPAPVTPRAAPPPAGRDPSVLLPPEDLNLEGVSPENSLAVLGDTDSGKTVFFGMMQKAFSSPKWAGAYNLEYRREGFRYLSRIRLDLEKGIWPASSHTSRSVVMGATLSWQNRLRQTRTRHLVMTDLSGEQFKTLFGIESTDLRSVPTAFRPLVERLAGSGGLILLVDGLADEGKLYETGLHFYAFLRMVISARKLGDRQKLKIPVAVLFTKYDQMSLERKRLTPEALATARLPDLHRELELRVPEELRYFGYCAAIGNATPGAPGEKPRIPRDPSPYNVADSIVWVATRMVD